MPEILCVVVSSPLSHKRGLPSHASIFANIEVAVAVKSIQRDSWSVDL